MPCIAVYVRDSLWHPSTSDDKEPLPFRRACPRLTGRLSVCLMFFFWMEQCGATVWVKNRQHTDLHRLTIRRSQLAPRSSPAIRRRPECVYCATPVLRSSAPKYILNPITRSKNPRASTTHACSANVLKADAIQTVAAAHPRRSQDKRFHWQGSPG